MHRGWVVLFIAVSLGQFVWRGEDSMATKSPTWDERMHIDYGLNLLRLGPTVDARDHPYPYAAWLALPLWLQRPQGQQLHGAPTPKEVELRVIEHPDNLFPVRRVNLYLATVGLLLLGLLAGHLWGPPTGVLLIILGSLDPGWLAHARLATTDMAHGLGWALAAMSTFGWCTRGRRRWLLGSGLGMALAMTTKFSGFVVPAFLLTLLAAAPVGVRAHRLVGISLATVGAGLLFLLPFSLRSLFGDVSWHAVGHHLSGALVEFRSIRSLPQGTFLWGRYHPQPPLHFFPSMLLTKTPLFLMLPLAIGALTGGTRAALGRPRTLWLIPLGFLIMAVVSGVTLGHRHLTPLFPFLWLAGALGLGALAHQHRAWMVLPLLLAAEVAGEHPHYIPWTNGLFGGVEGAHQVAVDSSTDWGQDLPALAGYLRAHTGEAPVDLAYFGTADPTRYGIRARWRPCGVLGRPPWPGPRASCDAPANTLAISATCLAGAAGGNRQDPCYDWLQNRKPHAILGGSILVFHDVRPSP